MSPTQPAQNWRNAELAPILDLIKGGKNLEEVAKITGRHIPLLRQKLADYAVLLVRRGSHSKEEALLKCGVAESDYDLILSYVSPEIDRLKGLLVEALTIARSL